MERSYAGWRYADQLFGPSDSYLPDDDKPQRPASQKLGLWSRIGATAIGLAGLGSGAVAVFVTHLEAGPVGLLAAVLAQIAYQGGREDATPVTRALPLERVAWAAARSGDLRSCKLTLGLVEDSFAAGPRDNDPDWVYWLNREEIDVTAGRCYAELGKPAQAEKLLTGSIGPYDQTLIRENSLYLSWLAEDYVQLGEVEHAADMATRMAVLAGRTNSARADTRLHFLAGRLEPYRANGSVADFFDAYQAVKMPRPRNSN